MGSTVTVPANRSAVPVALGPGVPGRVRRAIAGADLVHVHEPLMPLVSWSALATTVPIVGTFHADPSNLIRRSYRVAGPVLGIRRRLAAVTAVSQVAAAAVEPLFDEITVIPNAVEVGTVPDVDRVATRVAFVGRDDARKGLDVLLEAWPGVVAAIPGAELVVIGTDRADRPGVRFLGRIADADKMAALAGAAVFCAPNLGGESFGITLVEAMAAGCRVVASDLPGFREVLGGLGDLVPPGDPEALAGALVTALAAPDDPAPLAEAGGRVRLVGGGSPLPRGVPGSASSGPLSQSRSEGQLGWSRCHCKGSKRINSSRAAATNWVPAAIRSERVPSSGRRIGGRTTRPMAGAVEEEAGHG